MNNNFENLTESQRQAVFHKDGPLLIIAGPGSGKTRVITYRIAALIRAGVSPFNICAITFTNKAADEMKIRTYELVNAAGVHISTFHSLCVRILREYAQEADLSSNFSIYDSKDQAKCMKDSIKSLNFDTSNFSPAKMLSAVSALKNNMKTVKMLKKESDDYFTKCLAQIYAKYQSSLRENNALDFDDLLLRTAELLKKNENVRTRLSNRFEYVLIDEYQDTNRAQYQIAKLLASEHDNICVTGDPDQSIYRWRGADIRNILDFEQDWPEAKVIKLQENFRSTPNILSLADRLISNNENRKIKKLIPTISTLKDPEFSEYEDEIEEAQGIAEKIQKLSDQGVNYNDIAIFYRVNSLSRTLEEVFIKKRIPYQVVRGVEFYSRKEIRDILAYLKVLTNPEDEIALLRIINTPTRGIGKTTIGRVRKFAEQKELNFYEALKKADSIPTLTKAPKSKIANFVTMIESFRKDIEGPVAPLTERVYIEAGIMEDLQNSSDGQSAIENIEEFINAASQYDNNAEEPDLLDYLQEISLFSDADTYNESQDRVALMTLHASKGLEFDNVFIIGVEEGLLPHERSSDQQDEIEEERRLLFVGMTRTRKNLFISHSRYRTFRGQLLRAIPSQFLYEIEPESEKVSSTAGENSYSMNEEINSRAGLKEDKDPEEEFAPGQMVKHKKFGIGRVAKYKNMGENSIVEVKFNTGQKKSLMVKYAKLAKIS